MTKIIALYLPQFHEIEENNEWWGKGHTEWVNCKNSKPLFNEHYQPRIPLNDNYYNLLNESTQIQQAKMANDFGIYGFCYYHYWFTGKLLLEKPAENMLINKEIKTPFCFSWANHSWMNKNNKFKQETLLKQEYGDEKDWKDHFYYFLKFFKDNRYIQIDGKPVLIIHDSPSIPQWKEMKTIWDKLAKSEGLAGIYYINTLKNDKDIEMTNKGNFDAQFECQPTFALNSNSCFTRLWNIKRLIYKDLFPKVLKINYDKVWNLIFKMTPKNISVPTYLGVYNDWDITPRWGKRGIVHIGANPKKFSNYLKKQIERSKEANSEYIFINAWNEWSEGAYLEPDEKFKYGYLEAIKRNIELD